jgi:very-short-patch-repair endonuclease
MKISKRALSIKYNIEVQWLTILCEKGYLKYECKNNRIFIEEDQISNLVEGTHYVVCPCCSKKLGSMGLTHFSVCCPTIKQENRYASINLEARKKSDLQKEVQSRKLKDRFETEEGIKTKKIIQENSIRINSDPEFLKRKRIKSKEVQNRPEVKSNKKLKSDQMWADPIFREKRVTEIKENIDKYRESAANARKYLTKTSKLHESYKVAMLESNLSGFITEYQFDYYSIDEADPFAKIAIEIDGCYWHGCSVCGFEGDSRIKKIDKRKETYLKNKGWVIIRIKEHELKSNKYCGIEAIRSLQTLRRNIFSENIRKSFLMGTLSIKSLNKESKEISWKNISEVMRHHTPHKNIFCVSTSVADIGVTEDHSLFDFKNNSPVKSLDINIGDKIIGKDYKDNVIPLDITGVSPLKKEKYTYDLSVPDNECFFTAQGILAHNSYSISGVSLDIEKSSKYQSMKDSFESEYDKLLEQAKRSIKIAVGLKQPRYGIGISSALGPYSRPGVQSRRNFASGARGGWS